jgi:hypothetical protein
MSKLTLKVGISATLIGLGLSLIFMARGVAQSNSGSTSQTLPYRLDLAVSKDQYTADPAQFPTLELTVANEAKYKTGYWMTNPMEDYTFDVQYLPADSNGKNWTTLKSSFHRKPAGVFNATKSVRFRNVRIILGPNEKSTDHVNLIYYDFSRMGDYRIKASILLPDSRMRPCKPLEYNDTPNARVLTKYPDTCDTVEINSNTLYLRHTNKGFEAGGPQSAHKSSFM